MFENTDRASKIGKPGLGIPTSCNKGLHIMQQMPGAWRSWAPEKTHPNLSSPLPQIPNPKSQIPVEAATAQEFGKRLNCPSAHQ